MIVVSILMITYNHENFIREAIEGVLMQKTNFPIELVIGEDCSTDNTREIVMEYAGKFPGIIKPLLPNKNLGMSENFMQTLQACAGKYIALCEGDDYWTDPYKLEKQVDFLETNEEYSICSHRYKIYSEDTKTLESDINEYLFEHQNTDFVYDKYNFYNGWYTHTLTVLFRRSVLDFDFLFKFKYLYDYTLFYLILGTHNGILMNFDGAVYRKHLGGVWSGSKPLKNYELIYNSITELSSKTNDSNLNSILGYHTKKYIKCILRYGDHIYIKKTPRIIKEYFRTSNDRNKIYILLKIISESITKRIFRSLFRLFQ